MARGTANPCLHPGRGGGVAAAVSAQMRERFHPAPALIVVEPDKAACLLASAVAGEPATVSGNLDTIMAGLACGKPSIVAWHELNHAARAFMAIPDEAAIACMLLLAEHRIEGGESGVAGLAGCLLASNDPKSRETIGLTTSAGSSLSTLKAPPILCCTSRQWTSAPK
jgi:diaminopropionate ammonia-lyase